MRPSSAHAGEALWLPRAWECHRGGGALFSEFVDLMYMGARVYPPRLDCQAPFAHDIRQAGRTDLLSDLEVDPTPYGDALLRLAAQIQLGEFAQPGIHRALKCEPPYTTRS